MAREHRVLRWIERLLIMGGLAALGWSGFVLSEAVLYQRFAFQSLAIQQTAGEPDEDSAAVAAPNVEVEVAPVGTPVAAIEIPRLHLSAAVLEGSDDGTLRRGPGHIENTAWPGQSGNVGIAGHRDTFFRSLRDAQLGDEILLTTPRRRTVYYISSIRIVRPSEVSVLAPTSTPTLTLVTCYPFSYVGAAPMRYVVRASALDSNKPATTTVGTTTVSPGGEPTRLSSLPGS